MMIPAEDFRRHEVERGQAMVEYALLLGLVTVVSLGALSLMGTDVNGMLMAVQGAIAGVPGA
jgi:Flp pilus assembly pilin Flp